MQLPPFIFSMKNSHKKSDGLLSVTFFMYIRNQYREKSDTS